jgi:tetratricopeptide (TPR) repeat protein
MTRPIWTTARRQTGGSLFRRGIAAAQAGQHQAAAELFSRLLSQTPDDEQAWLWMARVSGNPHQARACLHQVLRINPHNQDALHTLRHGALDLPAVDPAAADTLPPRHTEVRAKQRQLGIRLLLIALLVSLSGLAAQTWVLGRNGTLSAAPEHTLTPHPSATPTTAATPTPSLSQRVGEQLPVLEQAWARRDWRVAAGILNEIAALDGEYPGLDAGRCNTYLYWARDLVEQGHIKEAYKVYRQASAVCQDLEVIQEEKGLALSYLSGKWRYDRELWREAAIPLQALYDVNPEYAETRSLLYDSYIRSCKASMAENDSSQALTACQAALELEPESREASDLIKQIQNKRIEVSISKQRMYVWQGDTLLYEWVCSTGIYGGTAAGHFSVLDKIPEAWASTWSLRMPYWLGIYWSGSLENGIHALPIRSDGSILWDGYLGTPVSYGCIILSTENARTLFNWAEVGTPVRIYW